MGAALGPSPHKVATEFVRVYYSVVAKLPSRLAELYGDESQLDHGSSLRATGRQAIADLADNLPIVKNNPVIDSVVGQSSANGNVIVVVRGSYSSTSLQFVQTFLLAKQSDSHEEHFYCCNDIFLPVHSEHTDEIMSDAQPSNPSAEPVTPPKLASVPTEPMEAISSPPADTGNDDSTLPSASLSTAITASPHTGPSGAHEIQAFTDPEVGKRHVSTETVEAPVITIEKGESSSAASFAEDAVLLSGDVRDPQEAPTVDLQPEKGQVVSTNSSIDLPPPSGEITVAPSESQNDVATKSGGGSHFLKESVDEATSTASLSTASADRAIKNDPPVPVKTNTLPKAHTSKTSARGGSQRTLTNRKSDQDYRASNATVQVNSRRPTSGKKTWASVVLSRDDVSHDSKKENVDIGEELSNGQPITTPEVSTTPITKASTSRVLEHKDTESMVRPEKGTGSEDLVEKTPEVGDLNSDIANPNEDSSGQIAQASTQPASISGLPRGTGTNSGGNTNGRLTHSGRVSRVFGPSAVVALSSTGTGQTDLTNLKNNLREEFSRYGHNLRGVEIKTSKGIAFLEYDTMDGVRAAVEAWADGPRQDGVFAGIALNVSEKRVNHTGRRPVSTRGGGRGGGARGGARRGRPPATS